MMGSSCIMFPPLCDWRTTLGLLCGLAAGTIKTGLTLVAPERRALCRLHAVLTFHRVRFGRGQIRDERTRFVTLRRGLGDTGREHGHSLDVRRQGTDDLDAGQ